MDFDPLLKLETGKININKLISKSRLVVHSYDSTGILETLSQNIPTLAFWQNGFDHLENSAIPHYQALADVGIIHLSPESIAKKINDVWKDVDQWWSQTNVQKQGKNFVSFMLKQLTILYQNLKEFYFLKIKFKLYKRTYILKDV